MKIPGIVCPIALLVVLAGSVGSAAETLTAKQQTRDKQAAAETSMARFEKTVRPFLKRYCISCHGPQTQEGELSLAKLAPNMKTSTSGARWAMVVEKLSKRQMPPDGEQQPKQVEVQPVIDWIKAEMKRSGKHLERRAEYKNGNKLPHELLFDPKQSAPFEVGTRIRRLSPNIYEEFLKRVGKRARGLNQPFSPSAHTTFKDMGAPKIDEPITNVLLRNALAIVEQQTAHKMENGEAKRIGWSDKHLLRLFDTKNPATDKDIKQAIERQFDTVLKRKPTEDELKRFLALMHKNIKDAGREAGVKYTLAAVFLLPEAVFRWEVGQGPPDEHGRIRLSPREIAFALSYALTDRRPDTWLLNAAREGKLDDKQGVAAAVQKMLDDPKLDKPRILRFFREYFQYDRATEVFKDRKDNPEHDARILVDDTDRLIENILERDQNVLYELLTTNKSFVAYKKADDIKKKRAEARRKFLEKKRKNPEKYKNKTLKLPGRSIYDSYNLSDFPDKQPVELPADQRAGILTQPAWLVAFSKSDENHAIFRGKWVRERLLGNVVPDIPITVDAQLPDDPDKTLRKRMAVTQQDYCWQCHKLMNPVGLPFEMYDHYGRYRETEPILDLEATAKNVDQKGRPQGPVYREVAVDATGRIDLTGDSRLKHDVTNAVQMLRKLAKSERVEQLFVRHAFRYFMGRNETLGDGPTLQAAHKAYKKSGGSMQALIVSLLSSDSFLYRVR